MNDCELACIQALSTHTPFTTHDLAYIFDMLHSIDVLIAVCEFAVAGGYSDLSAGMDAYTKYLSSGAHTY